MKDFNEFLGTVRDAKKMKEIFNKSTDQARIKSNKEHSFGGSNESINESDSKLVHVITNLLEEYHNWLHND